MSSVLITGVAGFIGMHTAVRFLKEGWCVVGLDNLNDYYSQELKNDRLKVVETVAKASGSFTFYKGDLNSVVWQNLTTQSFDVVIHLAAQAGVRYSIENPSAYLESNVSGFLSVLEFVCGSCPKARFIYASSSSVYGKNSSKPFMESEPCNEPESFYAATKRMNELMAYSFYKTKGLKSIGLRFFTVYGPWGRPDMAPMLFAQAVKENEAIRVFNYGRQQRDFTYIDDIVEGIFRSAIWEGIIEKPEIFNIGNGCPVSLENFIGTLEKNYGKQIKKEFVQAQAGDVESTHASVDKLSKYIDYKPQFSLEEGIARFVKWHKEYYADTEV